jgi:hypothetical protein
VIVDSSSSEESDNEKNKKEQSDTCKVNDENEEQRGNSSTVSSEDDEQGEMREDVNPGDESNDNNMSNNEGRPNSSFRQYVIGVKFIKLRKVEDKFYVNVHVLWGQNNDVMTEKIDCMIANHKEELRDNVDKVKKGQQEKEALCITCQADT